MGKILTELIKKHGFALVIGAITLDGYRRTVANDRTNNTLEKIRKESEEAQKAHDEAAREEYLKDITERSEKANECAVLCRYKEAVNEHHKSTADYHANSTSEYRKNEMDRAKKKLDVAFDEFKDLKELSIFEYFNSFYNNYTEFLDTLPPDKIACVFNIIMGV